MCEFKVRANAAALSALGEGKYRRYFTLALERLRVGGWEGGEGELWGVRASGGGRV